MQIRINKVCKDPAACLTEVGSIPREQVPLEDEPVPGADEPHSFLLAYYAQAGADGYRLTVALLSDGGTGEETNKYGASGFLLHYGKQLPVVLHDGLSAASSASSPEEEVVTSRRDDDRTFIVHLELGEVGRDALDARPR